MTDHAVRPARARDLPLIAAIEDSGIALFEEALGDLTGDALASPAPSGTQRAAEPGFLLVAGDPAIGFAPRACDLESHAHLAQISVHPDHARRGVGGALLEAAAERATAQGARLAHADDLRRPAVERALLRPPRLRRVRRGRAATRLRSWPSPPRRSSSACRGTVAGPGCVACCGRTARPTSSPRSCPPWTRPPGTSAPSGRSCSRPGVGEREVLEVGHLDVADGLVGDSWAARGSRRTADGSAHPDMQLNIIEPPTGRVPGPGPRARGAGGRPDVRRPRPVARQPARVERAPHRRPRGRSGRGDRPAAQRLRQVHRPLRQGRDDLRQRARGQAASAARAVRQGGAARTGAARATRWSSYAPATRAGRDGSHTRRPRPAWEHASMSDETTREFTTVGVIGLGTMGAGIAEVFARNGYAVIGVEVNETGVERGRQHLEHSTGRAVKREKMTEAQQAELLGRITLTTEMSDARRRRPRRRGGRGVARDQEGDLPRAGRHRPRRRRAGHQHLLAERHRDLHGQLQARPRRRASTSSTPRRCRTSSRSSAPWSPSPTSWRTSRACCATSARTPWSAATRPASSPTPCSSATSTTRSSMYEGSYASREDIDAAMRFGCGYPMGPLALLDLIGLDTAYEILDTMYKQGRDRLHAPAPILKQYVTAGLLGRKSGRGFYTYEAPDSPVVVADAHTPERGRQAAAAPRHQARRRGGHRHDGGRHRRGLRQGRPRRALHRARPGQGRRGPRRDHQELRQADPAGSCHRGAEGRGARPGARHHLARRPQGRRPRGRGDRGGPGRRRRRSSRTSTRSASPARSWRPPPPRCRSSRWRG